VARKWFATCALLFAACGSGDEGAASTAGPFPGSPGNPWTPNIPKPVQGPVLLAPGEPEAMAFDEAVDHGWFPLEPGVLRTYEGTDEGRFRVDLVRTLEPKRVLEGVACRAVMQEVFLDGVLYEVTTEWFAQDAQGNVWKFGEESSEREGVVWALSGDSWLAGVDGARPWLFLAAAPEKGDVYVGNAADGQDVLRFRTFMRALTVPPAQPAGLGAPPRVLFVWPQVITIETVLRGLRFDYEQFAQDGSVLVYRATCNFEQILDVRTTSEDLREEG